MGTCLMERTRAPIPAAGATSGPCVNRTGSTSAPNGGIAQLAVVDFMFVRIAQQLYDEMITSLELTYNAVQSHRLDYDRRARP